ncbi:MAG TPA: sulfotransferase, partial [Geminicoccaceae bacterium]
MSAAGAYGRIDRILHGLAFRGVGLQKVLADLEDQLYRKELEGVPVRRPVFITSLPRAGTTLMLEVVTAAPGFATHTYRNMPFILCPLLWERIAGGFRASGSRRERAHGDGLVVDFDSPEAFEEVVWRAFWPKKYRPDRIEPWSAADRDPEFEDFLRRHVAKIVRLQLADGAAAGRYVSKNNANVARIELLREIFEDGSVIVPFRDPVQQAASLLRQHRRFTRIHGEDPFARRYMEGIGHFEFGHALRPIDFGGWLDGAPADRMRLDFWLAYWCAAFGAVLDRAGQVRLVDYDRLCRAPEPVLGALADGLGIPRAELTGQATRFRPPS